MNKFKIMLLGIAIILFGSNMLYVSQSDERGIIFLVSIAGLAITIYGFLKND